MLPPSSLLRARRELLYRRLGPVVLALAFAAVAACGRRAAGPVLDNLQLTYDLDPRPLRVGAVQVTLDLKDAASRPESGARLSLEGDMSHPGMVPVFADATEVAPGRYRGRIGLTMAGDWVLLVHMTLRDGRVLDRSIPLPAVGAP